MIKQQYISILTKKDKVILKIDENAEQKQIIGELKKRMAELKKLYKEDTTPIFISGKKINEEEFNQIKEIIQRSIDVKVELDMPKVLGLHGIKTTFSKEIATSETKFHRGSIRSGQKIEFEGSLVVLGDVNSGAEVLAGENIVVLGILRGMAHAGAKGNKEAIIAAASIESAQIRIADIIREIEKEDFQDEIKTCAYANEEGQIILE